MELRRSRSIELANIEKTLVKMPEIAVTLIAEASANKLRSASDYDAKFSTQFIVAACLHKGKFGLPELADDVLGDEAILNLAFKVEYEIDRQTGTQTIIQAESLSQLKMALNTCITSV